MINKEYVENLTMAYIYSYNRAMNEIKNPTFAAQITACVIWAIANVEQGKQEPVSSLFEILLTNIADKPPEQEKQNKDNTENITD